MRPFAILAVLFLLTSSADGLPGETPGSQGWKAGVATTNITPEKPIWMAGYAARKKPAEGTAQNLYAKALALEDW
jgi:neutral ceramidase